MLFIDLLIIKVTNPFFFIETKNFSYIFTPFLFRKWMLNFATTFLLNNLNWFRKFKTYSKDIVRIVRLAFGYEEYGHVSISTKSEIEKSVHFYIFALISWPNDELGEFTRYDAMYPLWFIFFAIFFESFHAF